MRITGGHLRGRRVPVRVSGGVRPTSARVREALFSVLGNDLAGCSVLDACGGSGALTFESVSRGATVTTVERNPATAKHIARTARALGMELDLRVRDAHRVFSAGVWDVVLLDPPYADDPLPWVEAAVEAVGQTLVVEHDASKLLPNSVEGLMIDKPRTYGGTTLSVYWRRS